MNLDTDTREVILEQIRIKERILELSKQVGIRFYNPFPKQVAFHAAADYKYRMMRSGNRFGKSTMGCAEDCAWLMGERVWIPQGNRLRKLGIPPHAVKGLVITTDWDKVDEVWTGTQGEGGKIWRMLPKGFVIKTKRNHSGCIETIECKNGSILRFDTVQSFLKNPQGAESSDWDFIHVDEPCSQEQWKAASRGLMDRNGKAWFTLTPLSEFWINDMFFPDELTNQRASIWAEVGNTRDNPYLTEEAIAEYEASLTEEERQCRLNGIPLELSGLIYKEFSREQHVLKELPIGWTAWNKPPRDWTRYVAIDPHPRTPHAVLFMAVDPFDNIYIYDEIFLNMSHRDLAAAVLMKLRHTSHAPVKCDPIAFIADPVTGASMESEFRKAGLIVHKASKAKEFGILHARGQWARKNYIRVAPTCTYFIWEISRYCFDPKNNKPVDRDDHMMENMYRLLINTPRYAEEEPSESVESIVLDDVTINPAEDDSLILSDAYL